MALFDKRLLIISGKGGVGKTTVSLGLAMRAAEMGKRVIVCEVGENEKIAPFMGHELVGYKETEIRPNLSLIYLHPHESFAEYIRQRLKIEAIYKPIIESRIFRQFAISAPGFKELMTLGKIMDMERRVGPDGKPVYDLVIIDAPATGHGLSYFKVALHAVGGIRTGPVYANAKLILDLIRDVERTRMHIVTLPEEMPVNETLEMVEKVRGELRIPLGEIIVNAIESSMLGEAQRERLETLPAGKTGSGLAVLSAVTRQMESRSKLNIEHLARLKEQTDLPVIEVPYFYDNPWSPESVHKVGEAIL